MSNWWSQIKVRYNGRNIEFTEQIEHDAEIPIDVYDSIIENLLENARSKRIVQPEIAITVTLESDAEASSIRVCDSGAAIPEETASLLFRETLASEDGFGIGLYQSNRQAEQNGLALELEHNEEGRVCFILRNRAAS